MAKEENKNPEESGWKQFIYNPRSGEFLGRTASSWALILLFYLVFYGFLAGLFTLTMWVMLQTLDDSVPKYRDRVSSPGLMISPKSAGLEIRFGKNDPQSYESFVKTLHTFLTPYNDTKQAKNNPCNPGFYTEDKGEGDKVKTCQFNRTSLGPCAGIDDPSFGYSEGNPCVIVKMNRIIGLKPEGNPRINCTAKKEDANLQYYPDKGKIDLMYYPYFGKKIHENYVQPLVAVKIMPFNITGDEIVIECKIHGAPNLKNEDERDKFPRTSDFQSLY